MRGDLRVETGIEAEKEKNATQKEKILEEK